MQLINQIKKINSKIATFLTTIVSSMWCAYFFAGLAFISFPAAIAAGTAATVSWIAQTFLQLVLLSVIMVGQEVQGKKTERRAAQDHSMIKEQLDEIKGLQEDFRNFVVAYKAHNNIS